MGHLVDGMEDKFRRPNEVMYRRWMNRWLNKEIKKQDPEIRADPRSNHKGITRIEPLLPKNVPKIALKTTNSTTAPFIYPI